MPFSIEQRGFDDQGLRLRRITDALDHPDALLDQLAADLAQMWRDNIDAGPNERWEAGPSYRAQALGGATLVDTGRMRASIVGRQSGPSEITIGSDFTVGSGWNLLSIHEFGADVRPATAEWLTFTYPLGVFTPSKPLMAQAPALSLSNGSVPAAVDGWARKKQVRIPRRPTAPFDWDRGELTPEADSLVQSRISDYFTELTQ
jgi:phage gpG-like protein